MLSAPPVVELLQREFVNAWVLAKDLDAIAARDGEDVAAVCKLVHASYDYPVDSVVLGADLVVRGHVNVHEAAGSDPQAYLAFLRTSLAGAGRVAAVASTPPGGSAKAARDTAPPKPGVTRKPLVLTPDQPSASLLDTLRAAGFGQPSMAFVSLDATAFADGGVLEVEVRVGSGSAAGKFELCVAAPDPGGGARAPRAFRPAHTLPSVARETTAKLVHEFAKGERFGLAIMPADGTPEGDGNAFVATVTVRKR